VLVTPLLVLLPLCVFFVSARFRAPALAPLTLLAAAGVAALTARRPAAWVVFAAAYGLANVPWPDAVGEDPRGEALFRAEAALAAGRAGEAAARYQELLRRHPEEHRALLGLAAAREAEGDLTEALPLAGRAAAAMPGYWAAEWCLARLLDRAGRTGEALPHLEAAARDHPEHAEVRASLGLTLEAEGRDAAAQRELEAAARLGTGNAEAWNSLGRFRRLGGDVDGAAAALDRALRLDPAHWKARLNRGLLRAERGDAEGAREDLRAALAAAPDSAGAALARRALGILSPAPP
jgi:tetratricopeptide (TPR) repeat protein